MAAMGNQRDVSTLEGAQIHKALGAFLLFFGLVALASIFFTDDGIGKLTNLGAGIVRGGIGGIMCAEGLYASRRWQR